MEAQIDISWDEMGRIEILTFDLGNERFAFEAVMVREILEPVLETRVPESPPLVGSIINFRGRVIPVADLRLAFGQPQTAPTEESRIVVLESLLIGQTQIIGIKADRVHEVTFAQRNEAEMPDEAGVAWDVEFVRCQINQKHNLIFIPNLEKIFLRHCPCEKTTLQPTP